MRDNRSWAPFLGVTQMISRPVVMTGLLGAAVAGPIAMNEAPKFLSGNGQENAAATSGSYLAGTSPAMTPPEMPGLAGPGSHLYESPAPIEGVGFLSLSEMLRMDVTKEWVFTRWARKSTGLADPGLFGVRVPVVTGTAMTDLAGSLSYYFNAQGQVDRLKFHGRTADTTALVQIAQSQYGMTPRQGLAGEQLYQTVWSDKVLCELRTKPEPVLWSTSPHTSFVVDLEINRPGVGRFVQAKWGKPDIPPHPHQQPPPQPEPAPPAQPAEKASQVAETPPAESGSESASSITNAQKPSFRWPN